MLTRAMIAGAMIARVLLAAAGAALLASVVQAQNPRGSLRGTVQDATGARVASARIVVQAVDSSLRREVASEDRGEFRLDDLLPGAYSITVSAAGFAPAQADVVIAVSAVRDVAVTMKPSALQQTVNVQGNSFDHYPDIDLASAVHQGVVGSQDLEALPLPPAVLPILPISCPEPNQSSLPIPPRRASRRSPPEEVPD